ncbi:LysR family transcriptional regulator [Nonomuraea sediminis]|uniref:LysR family transcriptional regulator n=1 Tax=Nonomuraea sediminis TaxID=2835864 RepID=UPI001BDCD8AB|nr:LysR family transcriptional regulator [Nonomuraea sediminis]
MDLRRLHYFVVVAEEGNVGRAARRLHISQPPLSQRIRELEAELGCALFVRTPRGMTLTVAGEVLLSEARALLAAADGAVERVRQANGEQVLRVGVLGPAEAALSAGAAQGFAKRYPGALVQLRQGSLVDPTIGLGRGEVDVAITFTPFDETGLAVHVVRPEPLYAALPADDPLACRASITCADLCGRRTARLPSGADPIWAEFWQAPGDGPVVRSLGEGLHAVLWQQAVIYVPEKTTWTHPVPGVRYVLLADHPPAHLVLVRRSTDLSPLVTGYIAASLAWAQNSDHFGVPPNS